MTGSMMHDQSHPGGLDRPRRRTARDLTGRSSGTSPVIPILTILISVVWMLFPELIGRFLLLGIVAVPVVFLIYHGRGEGWIRRLTLNEVLADGDKLVELDEHGRIKASIDLLHDFTVTTPYRGNGKAVYEVRQGDQTLHLSSEAANAEHLVTRVLGLQSWPPDGTLGHF